MTLSSVVAWVHAHELEILGVLAAIIAAWKALPLETRASLEVHYPRLVGTIRTLVAVGPDVIGAGRTALWQVVRGEPRPEVRPSAPPPAAAPPRGEQGYADELLMLCLALLCAVGLVAFGASGCATGGPHVVAVAPRIVQRPEYGTCLEVGGKVEVPGHGVLTQLSSTCWEAVMDARADSDASAPEPAIEGKDSGASE